MGWRPMTLVSRRSTARSGGTVPASARPAHREHQETATGPTGFLKYSATLLPITGFSSDSAVRVSHGCSTMSHTSSLWYAATTGWSFFDVPTAHFNHQNGECSACA